MTRQTQEETTLVIGGTGKTGRRVVERLRARGMPVRVGSRSGDQTATVWDLASRERLGTTFSAEQGVAATQFAPDGDLVIAYSGAVKWPMDPRKWMRFACQVAGRDLTPAEWSDILPDRDYRRTCPQ
jgi:nucleoside-diphosphate-sugar epimerase